MSYSHYEISEALKVIQATCLEHGECVDCPFLINTVGCAIVDNKPFAWCIKDESKIWKAFKEPTVVYVRK